jgi:transposase InsO family protein
MVGSSVVLRTSRPASIWDAIRDEDDLEEEEERITDLKIACQNLFAHHIASYPFQPAIADGIAPWEETNAEVLYPLELRPMHQQVTVEDTRDLIRYLRNMGIQHPVLKTAGSPKWLTKILGVKTWDGDRDLSWARFRDLYPYLPVDNRYILPYDFVEIDRTWDESPELSIMHEYYWLLRTKGDIKNCLFNRLKKLFDAMGRSTRHMASQIEISYPKIGGKRMTPIECEVFTEQDKAWISHTPASRSSGSAAINLPRQSGSSSMPPPQVFSQSSSSSLPRMSLPPQTPMDIVSPGRVEYYQRQQAVVPTFAVQTPFPPEKVVDDVTQDTIEQLEKDCLEHRRRDGFTPRQYMFTERAWTRVLLKFPEDKRVEQETWKDKPWFEVLRRQLKGRGLMETDANAYSIIVDIFRETVKPKLFLNTWQEDADTLIKSIQEAIDQMKESLHYTTFSKPEYERLLKDLYRYFVNEQHAANLQLPKAWMNTCQTVHEKMKQDSNRDFSNMVSYFDNALHKHMVYFASMRDSYSIDLTSVQSTPVPEFSQQKVEKKAGVYETKTKPESKVKSKEKSKTSRETDQTSSKGAGATVSKDDMCWGCGKKGHKRKNCYLSKHPCFNKERASWAESTWGKEFAAKGAWYLPSDMAITPETFVPKTSGSNKPSGSGQTQSGEKGKEQLVDALISLAPDNSFAYDDIDYLIPCRLYVNRKGKEASTQEVSVLALVDTGGRMDKDLINSNVARKLGLSVSHPACTSCERNICSSINSTNCSSCFCQCNLGLTLIHNDSNHTQLIIDNIEVYIVEMRYDLIICLHTILRYDLLPILNSFFHNQYTFSVERKDSALVVSRTDHSCDVSSLEYSPPTVPEMSTVLPKEHFFGVKEWDYDGTEDLVTISDLLPRVEATRGEETSHLDDIPRCLGDTEFHRSIQAVCLEFSDIFSRTVTAHPADVPSFKLEVDEPQWQVKAHSKGARPQPPSRRLEVKRQIELMLSLGIISRTHDVGYYSQVLLVPKPGEKWRFCIDYRILNSLSLNNAGFPIPNIPSMLRRLGERKFKYAGKLDFSSGYHQVLMDPASSHLAAFICEEGVFVPNRLMFGVKAAPSFFQGHMAKTVLFGLHEVICELFIDDVFIWGRDEDEFLANLRSLFERLREKKISVHPDKCELGVKKIEFLGHVLDSQGISMSDSKINKVLDFPLPNNVKDLRSFVGLCNYFGDHIRNSAMILRPLHKSIARHASGLSKRKAQRALLEWSEEETEAFEEIKSAMASCPTLFFLNDTDEVYLLTDASDYGIGAYLYQLVDGKQHPIRFMSHTLSDVQLRWSTVEKECYAIFRACMEMEYLIRDRKFHLFTDHRNLVFLTNPHGTKGTSEKVVRWRLAIQEFDFDIAHIEGKSNIAADGFSRLVKKPEKEAREAAFLELDALEVVQERVLSPDTHTLISQFHNPMVGHLGLEKTCALLVDAGHKWRGLRRDVRLFIKQCPLCQKLSQVKPVVIAQPIHIGGEFKPFSRISVDTTDVVETKDGYKFILGVVDNFTRWIKLYPLKTLEASEAATCLLDWFGNYGFAMELLSDNGPQFVNELIDAILKAVGTQHILSLAYSKEENGRIERANKEILRHLRMFVNQSKVMDDWVIKLPFVQRIMNASVHSVTGFSPAALLFGNVVNLNRNILPTPVNESPGLRSDEITSDFYQAWFDRRNEAQQEVLAASANIQETLMSEHLGSLPAEKVTQFEVGAWVLAQPHENPMTGRRTSHKLQPYFLGPYEVLSKKDANTYILKDVVQDKTIKRHVTNLRPFYFDIQYTNPRDVATIDKCEFVVEKILDHKGDFKAKSTLEFLVKWKGYADEDNSWETWKELMHVTALHEYLRSKNLAKYIPGKPRLRKEKQPSKDQRGTRKTSYKKKKRAKS